MAEQRSIVISGAATGIGAEIAKRFLNLGWRVGAFDIADIDPANYPQDRGTLVVGKLDVTNFEQWQQVLAEFCGPAGTLDVLVNNAGVLTAGSFEEISAERNRTIIDINVNGTINGCHAAHEYLFRTRGATVVNLCSASAIYGQPELAAYSASKFAVRGLTEALDIEWQKHDIRVIALWPLFVSTNMVAGVNIGTTRSLGVHLRPEHVASELVRVLHSPARYRKVHYAVARQAKIFAAVSQFTPDWANRAMNRRFFAH